MTNKTKIYIGVGSAVALIGGYFIYKALRPKKPILNGRKMILNQPLQLIIANVKNTLWVML
jgi:hypothetical protein